ncbi:hypothetical protein [uncultured Ruegeria sp.]|uniref:hypothetical protein n=1 Tax=uncultured Ruegeria sp. TaxID=259304 RepID=UPI002610D6E4|nr:hypothetical protein [uncultured Ruegeria sp.]
MAWRFWRKWGAGMSLVAEPVCLLVDLYDAFFINQFVDEVIVFGQWSSARA